MKNFCSAKDNVKRIRQGDNICKRDVSVKGLLFKIRKKKKKENLLKLNGEATNNPI